jgi:hypothetical protein
MHAEDQHAPSLLEQAAQQAATHTARAVAKQALVKLGAVLGAKAGAVVAAVLAVIVLVVLLIVMIVSVAGAAFQSSTAVWPVPVVAQRSVSLTAILCGSMDFGAQDLEGCIWPELYHFQASKHHMIDKSLEQMCTSTLPPSA